MLKRSPCARSRPTLVFWLTIAFAILIACASGVKAATPFPDAPTARFSVEVVGTGPDLILIPGLNCSREVWEATAERLKGRYRLHLLHIAGFAGEPAGGNAQGPVITPSVEALNAYIVQNKLKDPIVVGHSLGGLMGLKLATRHPQALSKLVVVDALPFIGVLFNPVATVDTIAPQAAQLRDAQLKVDDATYKAQQDAARAALAAATTDAERHQRRIALWTALSDRRVSAQAFYDDMTMDLRPELSKITAAVTVLVPHHASLPYTAEQTSGFYTLQYNGTANLTIVGIKDSRHFIMYDQPQAFAEALDAALR
ncbi:alpha/beta fold hydrolase [Asticcacaulis excentricus]|uniref:Alpha/beta hydrolase fold-1 n=1 Tax=Asticcacaulis excentricus TaxID=78587 RepID=A0A3G9G5G0_9CAUL|nr:alpha/beta hydrolase [Asticcacaulis excentricus]BBF80214.1 alpha/beta hydrolase fold-1 [Asticcacaulis excentricus]